MDEEHLTFAQSGLLFVEALSDRELEILGLVAEGRSNQQIADELHLALTTVKWYNTQIFSKLGVNHRREAVNQARELGLLGTAAPGSGTGPNALPRLKSGFVGRQAELDMLEQMVQTGPSLITLAGPGGMGKTTLALMAAHRLRPQYHSGAYFVPLAAVSSASEIITAIAEEMHFRFRPDAESLQQQLFSFLAGQHALLVLDNFEHLVDEALLLSQLVEAAPQVTLIVTSRERLNLLEEVVIPVGGLGCPSIGSGASGIQGHEAAQLFLQCARRASPYFELAPSDVARVLELCALVGGMPLAIELAAGWVGVLSPEQIVTELRRSIDILETDLRDVPERQRSLRATLDSSWARLSAAERSAFIKLCVLEKGFDAAAAEAVAGADPRLLRQLVHRGLVGTLPSGRHTLHELLRQYGLEQLVHAGQVDAVRECHARYYAVVARTVYQGPYSLRHPAAMAAVKLELENLIAAWRFASRARLDDLIPAFVDCLADYIHASARYFEGEQWLSEGLAALRGASPDAPVPPEILGHVIAQLGNIYSSTNLAQARSLLAEAIQILEPLGPTPALLKAYLSFANYHVFPVPDERERDRMMLKACSIAAQIGDPLLLADAVTLRALASFGRRDLESALALGQEAHQLALDQGASAILATAKWVLADVHAELGHYETALRYGFEALDLAAESQHVYTLSGIHLRIANVYRMQGQLARGRDHIREVIRVHLLYGEDWQTVGAIYGLARYWYVPLGERERAVEMLAFATHHPLATVHTEQARQVLDTLERELGAQDFSEAYSRGRASELMDVVDGLIVELSA